MLKDEELEAFRKLLDDQYDWPADYLFKFVVPYDQVSKVEALFPDQKVSLRASAKGNYVSVTVTMMLESPDVVVAIYQQASKIPGLLSL